MDFISFIQQYKDKDTNTLRLSEKKKSFDFDYELALTQIDCRRKFSSKLKEILENPFFIFPDYLSGEQASHQAISKYHTLISNGASNIIDLTAGLGIDSIYFARNGANVTAIEINQMKAEALKKNAGILGLKNLKVINGDSLEILSEISLDKVDLIFVDPARRNSLNKRVYNLHDCLPDVLANKDVILKHTKRLLIKASPLLDITQTFRDFQNISALRIVGVKGECKEVLIELYEKPISSNPLLSAVNLDSDGNILSEFNTTTNSVEATDYINDPEELKVGSFILEPSAMIMKLAPWDKICKRYNAKKFDKSSHLFITDILPENFPGRVSKFDRIFTKQSRKSLEGFPATVVSKNHPLSSEEIRKKYKIKEGDKNFIYATRIGKKPLIFLCSLL